MPLMTRWNRFWFEPQSAASLGFCRIAVYVFLLWLVSPNVTHFAESNQLLWKPIHLFEWLRLPIFDARTLTIISSLFRLSLLLAAAGFLTRTSTWTAFFLSLYIYGLPQNFGKINHDTVFLPHLLLIFAASRCGDAVSLDAWMRRSKAGEPSPSGAYRWPIRAGWVLFALGFFACGFTKLSRSGLDWVFSENLQWRMLSAQYEDPAARSVAGLYISNIPWLCLLMAGMSILFELSAPVVLFTRFARWIVLIGLCGMMCGIRLCLGFWLTPWFVLFLLFIPWEPIAARWWNRTQSFSTSSPDLAVSWDIK